MEVIFLSFRLPASSRLPDRSRHKPRRDADTETFGCNWIGLEVAPPGTIGPVQWPTDYLIAVVLAMILIVVLAYDVWIKRS
jgi:hypothetical protein